MFKNVLLILLIYHNICTHKYLNMKGYAKKFTDESGVQYGHICMHGIKSQFVSVYGSFPSVSMAIRQSIPRSIRVCVRIVFLRALLILFFITALITL